MTTWLPRRLSVRLLVFSGLQLLLVGVALGLLGYASGRRDGLERLAIERQRHQLTTLVDALATRLQAPQLINSENVLAIRQGVIQLDDFGQLGQRFWRQMQLYPVGYINWGSRDGSFLGVERLDSGRLVLNEDSVHPLGRGNLGVYALGSHGERGALLEVVPGMDNVHQEAWYAETVKANRAIWSSIYQWEDKPHVFAISYNAPVRDNRGALLGVIGVDFVLSQLSTWLQQLWRGQPGMALIVEPSGLLVASSTPEQTTQPQGNRRIRTRIDRLPDALAQAASRNFFVPLAGGQQLRPHRAALARGHQGQQPATLQLNGQRYQLDARPWGQAQGLNWLVITATSQDEALLRNQQQSALAAALGLLALGAALLLNRQLIAWLLAPMELLRRRADQALQSARLPFEARLPEGAAVELTSMAESFGRLVQRLEQSQEELADASARERRKDSEALELLKNKLRSSLEASAVAHEIKLPLSQILLSCRMLQLTDEQQSQSLSPETRAQLNTIAAAAEEMLSTIEKMRTLLRNVQTPHTPLNLAHLVRSALLYLKPSISASGVEIREEGLETACPIQGDSAQLQVAIVNVLRNSLEALEHCSGPRRVRVRLAQQAGQALLQIDDNGPGFPALPNLLEPLQTGRRDGSGLGLFVVQTTLNHHNGSIELGVSDLGGAAVLLQLPLGDLPNSG